ncbi:MAG: NAD(P)-binding domain-containing protein [Nitratireductor sp.]
MAQFHSPFSTDCRRCGQGTIIIDSSTIDVASARKAHEIASAAGLGFLDAPVSGGVGGAAAGTLTFMIGGTEADFAKASPSSTSWPVAWSIAARAEPDRPPRSATTCCSAFP